MAAAQVSELESLTLENAAPAETGLADADDKRRCTCGSTSDGQNGLFDILVLRSAAPFPAPKGRRMPARAPDLRILRRHLTHGCGGRSGEGLVREPNVRFQPKADMEATVAL